MRFTVLAAAALAAASLPALAASEDLVIRSSALPSTLAPETVVTGHVRHDNLFAPSTEAPYAMNFVTFEAGSRTAWHTHPEGMRAVVISGIGFLGTEEEVITLYPGDIIYCPPELKHWHGAAADKAMTHLSVTMAAMGPGAKWGELVTDEEYAHQN